MFLGPFTLFDIVKRNDEEIFQICVISFDISESLKSLLNAKGKDYALNFQFSILEICDLNASEDSIIGREVHWKEVLKTREFGLNKN